ncbi:MAG: calcium-binding protein [Xenococcaceae cyanobacterium MO_234.B1]|nr:calcium-binding protein [Xenococcaceae cyanobacterium MO_234.B1]
MDRFDDSGYSVSNAGDINGDGIDDVIIGAPFADADTYGSQGQSYVVFGSDEGFDASFELADLDGTNGFAINGIDNFDNSGRSVSNAGDINGDGIDDVIIGAPYADADTYGSQGQSYVVFGSDEGFDASFELADLDGSNGFVITGINNYDNSGRSVSNAGDINGDGISDLIIGAPYADISSNYSSEGEAYVVFGSDEGFDASFELGDLLPDNGGDGSNGFVITGIDNYDNLGRSVSSAGDINGDGIDDLIIGAPNAGDSSGGYYYSSGPGQAYVIFGSSGGFDPILDLAAFDGSGLLITGINNFDDLGNSVSGAGDINRDGADDLIIGAPFADPNGNSSAGQSYVVFGVVPLELIGTENDDILTGANGDDFIDGRGGNDLLQGLGGNDQIFGGSGEDLIAAGDGNDTVEGGTGNDNISGNAGNDNITGDDGRDDILGGEGNDSIEGGSEADRILGEAGDDSINGGSGQDSLLGGQGNDLIEGGSQTDLIFGEAGDDSLNGDDGSDTVEGGVGQDLVAGGLGEDLLLGNSGDDSLSGGTEADTLIGGFDNDSLDGAAGNDQLIGVELTDPESEFGADEIDTLIGGASSDTFVLGDEDRVYYDDGDPLTAGESDFALITDFDDRQDFIQLNGSAELYSLDFFTSESGTTDAALIYDPGVTARGEVIATLQDVSTDLSVTDPSFIFV